MNEVLQAVNSCKLSLCEQWKCIKEEFSFVRHDLQNVREGRISSMKDDLNPIKQEIKMIGEKVNIYVAKMDDMENRLWRNNVKIVGLPERIESPYSIIILENWLKR